MPTRAPVSIPVVHGSPRRDRPEHRSSWRPRQMRPERNRRDRTSLFDEHDALLEEPAVRDTHVEQSRRRDAATGRCRSLAAGLELLQTVVRREDSKLGATPRALAACRPVRSPSGNRPELREDEVVAERLEGDLDPHADLDVRGVDSDDVGDQPCPLLEVDEPDEDSRSPGPVGSGGRRSCGRPRVPSRRPCPSPASRTTHIPGRAVRSVRHDVQRWIRSSPRRAPSQKKDVSALCAGRGRVMSAASRVRPSR